MPGCEYPAVTGYNQPKYARWVCCGSHKKEAWEAASAA